MSTYKNFLEAKSRIVQKTGFDVDESALNRYLFPFQRFIVKKALKAGKYALFEDCGLGKTIQQLDWAYQVSKHTSKPVLILTPLAVSDQTIEQGDAFGIKVVDYHPVLADLPFSEPTVFITNYEQLEKIDCSVFSGVVLDESSILKNFTGYYRNLIIDKFRDTPYKLACTATPGPNDELEIGNHAEFLDVMSSRDMRAIYFTTDKDIIKGNKYRIKKHAESEFYRWISSWSTVLSNPSDIGFDGSSYVLPELLYHKREIKAPKKDNGKLFNDISVSATDFNRELRITKVDRMSQVADIVNKSTENFIIWVKLDEEADYLKSLIPDAVEVRGSDPSDKKKKNLLGFGKNEFRVLITKTKIASFGLNFQNCHNQIFASLDFSFEALYQAIRRSYRFGQKFAVNIYLVTTDTMQNVISSIEEKERKYKALQSGVVREANKQVEGFSAPPPLKSYSGKMFDLQVGDNVQIYPTVPDESIDYTFFSPPFGAMYVFSADPRDMSNVRDDDEFMKHFEYIVPHMYRTTKPGRLVTMHIMQSTTLLGQDGYYSLKDFRGEIIRLMQRHGFYFHEEHMIRKDPKTAAIRTKNRQLMHGTTKIDSTIVRPGLADYVLSFKKPGVNAVPVQNNIPFDLWCKMAEPVWMEINEGDTLSFRNAKDNDDERHLTPTQLKTIEWCYHMYVNKGELVCSPFAGICSEGYQAIKMGIRFKGMELKESYADQGFKNLKAAELENSALTLF